MLSPRTNCRYVVLRFIVPLAWWALVAGGLPTDLPAIEVEIDYRYDTQSFFGTGTQSGQQARQAIEAAADFFSEIITDSLAAIPYLNPSTPGPQNSPVWRQVFRHPGTGQANFVVSSAANAGQDGLALSAGPANEYRDIAIPQNQVTIYAGGTPNLGTLAESSSGFSAFGTQSFLDDITHRGKSIFDFSTWGGSITFDSGANWHFAAEDPVPSNRIDFYSVALHEIGHSLGLNGSSDAWNAFQFGSEFRGPQSLAAWRRDDPAGSAGATGIPTVSSLNHHWKDNDRSFPFEPSVESFQLGTRQLQEAAMDPVIFNGRRKLFTNVDTFALRDIGWNVPDSVFAVTALQGDYSGNGVVGAPDYVLWRDTLGSRSDLRADGNGNGVVDAADFNIWKNAFGQSNGTAASLASAQTNVPEPATLGGTLLAFLSIAASCRSLGKPARS